MDEAILERGRPASAGGGASPAVRAEPAGAEALRAAWNGKAERVEEAMHAILHGVRDPEAFDRAGRAQAERLLPFLPREGAVLEVGCGMGRVLKHLHPHCGELWGVDISERMLEHARRWLGERRAELRLCNGRDLQVLDDGRFRFAYSLLVLQHMDKNDAYVYLKEIFRVLEEGGRMLVNFPDILSDTFLRDFTYVSLQPPEARDPAKVRAYAPEEVRRIVASAGFRILDLWTDEYVYVHAEKAAGAFPTRLVMGINDAAGLGIKGWYWLEEEQGRRFRWTGKRASFFLRVEPGHHAVRVCCACMHPPARGAGVELSLVHGGRVVSRRRVPAGGWREILLPLEPGRDRAEVRHLALEVDRTFTPRRDGVGEDDRELGVAVAWIRPE